MLPDLTSWAAPVAVSPQKAEKPPILIEVGFCDILQTWVIVSDKGKRDARIFKNDNG